ncbi:hypothetical protein [Tolypothrix sp. NIES-4075]|uniref:hypothetical protein n=1 Tax=Tolypothrix sp. NIES-4075 TaxID=2005459 RepID=UPI00117E2D9B|nr:hypothetical protein [Tolypothrix sp. NIES-4075]
MNLINNDSFNVGNEAISFGHENFCTHNQSFNVGNDSGNVLEGAISFGHDTETRQLLRSRVSTFGLRL